MDLFLCLCVLFCVGSISGWVIELFYRRFFSSHKWINPGFLTGPYLPLYGFGVALLFLIIYYLHFDEWFNLPRIVNDLLIILVLGIAMTIIELIAGLIFIDGLKIKLWDYSTRPLNYKGIICPLFSLIWTLVGALFYYFLYDPFVNLLNWFATTSLQDAYIPFFLGIFYGVFIVDLNNSLQLTVKIRKLAKENNVIVTFEKLKENIRDVEKDAKKKIHYIFAFKSELPLKDHVINYISKIKNSDNKKSK